VDDACLECERVHLAGLVRREAVVLAVLIAIMTATFFLTRQAAAYDRASSARAAASWFDAGHRALSRGDTEEAITGFRQAALKMPRMTRYHLTLADALATAKRDLEARRILLRLRESAPENAEINLALARLAVRRADVAEATRFYHHAIYGVWNDGNAIEPARERRLRTELIHFLLDRGRSREALSQILLLAQHLPDELSSHVDIGRLFLRAGSPENARGHFAAAIALKGSDPAALAGAVEAAFALRDYGKAGVFLNRLRRTGEMPLAVLELAPVLDVILRGDPLTPRLSAAERSRRLAVVLDRAIARASSCVSTSDSPDLAEPLRESLELRAKIRPAAVGRDRDLAQSIFERAVRLEQLTQACAAAEPIDRAVLLLGQKYADTAP
jgi:Tfp pilus assembly protein PilF